MSYRDHDGEQIYINHQNEVKTLLTVGHELWSDSDDDANTENEPDAYIEI